MDRFSVTVPSEVNTQNKIFLSFVAQMFDPLKFINPVIVTARIFMEQSAWLGQFANCRIVNRMK